MGKLHRPYSRPFVLFALAAVALLLTACGSRISTGSFAGLSTDGQKVYLANGPEVLAYDPETQQVNWTFPAEPNSAVLFYAAPNNEDGQVVFGNYGQAGGFLSPRVTVSIYALEDTDSGTPPSLWTNTTAATDKIVAPALQEGDKVFMGTADNHIFALDRTNGTKLWDYKIGHAVWGQPAYRDGVVYVASMDWSMYALDAETGELVWTTPLNGALASRPVLNGQLLYVTSFDGSVHALDIETGAEQWSAAANDAIWGAPALGEDGRLYFGDIAGDIHAVNAETGESIWDVDTAGVIQAAPILANNMIYVASQTTSDATTGSLTAYSATDGEQVWTITTPVPLWTTPVVLGNSVVVALQGSDALLIGYDLESGSELWRYVPPATS
ncbi:MAG: PQQ-binding-like beta-propeller repeat protein [Chloroflexota bacterium]